MPSVTSWLHFSLVHVLLFAYVLFMFVTAHVAAIRQSWPEHRCNPLYMIFADDVSQNFTQCVHTSQSNYMGFLLQPLTYVTQTLGVQLSSMMTDINEIRSMFSKVRTLFATIIQDVFGVFLNLIIEFRRISIALQDMMGKNIGIMTTLLYTLDGSIQTMQSTWNGPPGQSIRALGKCFLPETPLRLATGEWTTMSTVPLGAQLCNGARVLAILHIDNKQDAVPMFVLPGPVFVTASHFVYTKSWIRVHTHPLAERTDWFPPTLCCLITDTHTIPVGTYLFWDWEDDVLLT